MSVITYSTNKEIHDLRVKLGCSQEIMGRIIGVTGRTVARWEGEESEPHFLARQQVRELHNLLEKADGIIKKGAEREWLNTPSEALENKTPLEVIQQGSAGVHEVVRLLGQIEWGIAA